MSYRTRAVLSTIVSLLLLGAEMMWNIIDDDIITGLAILSVVAVLNLAVAEIDLYKSRNTCPNLVFLKPNIKEYLMSTFRG